MKDNNSDDDKPKVSENRRLWENVWDKVICAQEVWSEMVRLSIISSLMDLSLHNQVIHETDTGIMKEPDKDFRCIFLMFCQTSSGKDLGGSMARYIMQDFGYRTSRASDFTTASMVGSSDAAALQHNQRKKLEPGDPDYKESIIKGKLAKIDYWTITEMELVLNEKGHREGTLITLRQAMDNDRTIEKDLVGVHIEYKTPTNFLCTSFPKDTAIYQLVWCGLFQRLLFYYNEIDKRTDEIEDHQIDKGNEIFSDIFETSDFRRLIRNFEKYFKDKKVNEIVILDEIKEVMKEKRDQLRASYQSLAPIDICILNSMMRRGINIIKNLGKCYALDNKKMEVGKQEISQAFDIFETCMLSMKSFLRKLNKTSKLKIILKQIFGDSKVLPSKQVQIELEKIMGVKYGMARLIIRSAQDEKILKEENKKIRLLF